MELQFKITLCLAFALVTGVSALTGNDTCTGAWTSWSGCFPGTTSDSQGFQERWFVMEPSQANASIPCMLPYSVLETQTRPCTTTAVIDDLSDPTLSDCAGKYRCANGRCINKKYTCNGDDDCGDASDEYPIVNTDGSKNCTNMGVYVCGMSQMPGTGSLTPIGERFLTGIPGIGEFASGFDILTGEFRSGVLSMSPHGSCRRTLISGMTDTYYRIPKNIASFRQIYDVTLTSVKVLDSAAAILNNTKTNLMYNLNFGGSLLNLTGQTGLSQNTFTRDSVTYNINNDEERTYVTQAAFVSTAEATLQSPSELELSTAFISRVMKLPYETFSYSQYLSLIRDYGTHYVAESKLGGEYQETNIYSRCWLDSKDYEAYSSTTWKSNLVDCTRQGFYYNLSPNTSSFTSNCMSQQSATVTSYLQDEMEDKVISVRGGSIVTSSNLKFSFSKSTWDSWVQTITNGPVLNTDQFRLQKISSLMSSPSIPFSNRTRQQNVADFIDQAINIYLSSYNADTLCAPCGFKSADEVDENGMNVPVYYYGVPYVTGTSNDYQCYCTYGLPPDQDSLTCGSTVPTSMMLLTLISCILTALSTYSL